MLYGSPNLKSVGSVSLFVSEKDISIFMPNNNNPSHQTHYYYLNALHSSQDSHYPIALVQKKKQKTNKKTLSFSYLSADPIGFTSKYILNPTHSQHFHCYHLLIY